MQNILRPLKNIFINAPKRIKEISDSNQATHYKCLKCGGELIANKGYGQLHIVCKCGHGATVYTGRNVHRKNDSRKTTWSRPITKEQRTVIDEELRVEVFYNHLNSDFTSLCNMINEKRDITKQLRYKECVGLFDGTDNKEGYEKVSKYLQKFCDLESIPLEIVWKPLSNENTLSSITTETNVIGTTYRLPLGLLLFYTIYLNPQFIQESRSLLGLKPGSEILIATIAHELSHIYSSHNNIQFTSPDNERGDKAYREQMTDLLGIVLGMGELICAPSAGSNSFDTGYLTNDMIRKSYDFWKSEYLSGKNKDIRTLFICTSCSQKLRVPISKETLHLVCPKCKTKFEYRSFK
jgi:DNA-directed RNA polymerase subunit RPC12/RpoP